MDSNQNINEGSLSGRIETTDDVEGHGAFSNRVNPDETGNDVEGHGTVRGGLEAEQADDVEGHATRGKGFVEDEGDDVEGHGVRIKI